MGRFSCPFSPAMWSDQKGFPAFRTGVFVLKEKAE